MGVAQPTRDTLAEGLVGLVRPSLESLDESVAATREAQAQLKDKIQSLENQLVQLQASVNRNQSGVDLEAYINKLTSSKKRILVVNSILQGAQVLTTYLLMQAPTFSINNISIYNIQKCIPVALLKVVNIQDSSMYCIVEFSFWKVIFSTTLTTLAGTHATLKVSWLSRFDLHFCSNHPG